MKIKSRHKKVLVEIICLLFIILFVYAGLTKLMEGDRFYTNLNNSPLFGIKTLAGIMSWVIPILEIMIAALLAWPKTRLIGLYSALGLMIIFTAYTAGILFISPYAPCSCGGVITLLSWKQHFILNTLWIVLAIMGIVLYPKFRKLYGPVSC
ncbi:MauE/DoxX family redox-associated membrane protein [Sinomicrobium oceani]|uniref:MauE/DoxX family redox-associated membrane protein n=1 Tax=Sinomicrobium oceani TaxID=1150368 RepID=UPI00227AA966|nr:MauE/DoxX family redox-associated membrane protein [Sinomicrobium oceani]